MPNFLTRRNQRNAFKKRYAQVAAIARSKVVIDQLSDERAEIISRLRKAVVSALETRLQTLGYSNDDAFSRDLVKRIKEVFVGEVYMALQHGNSATIESLWQLSLLKWVEENKQDLLNGKKGLSDDDWGKVKSEGITKAIIETVTQEFDKEQKNVADLNKKLKEAQHQVSSHSKELPADALSTGVRINKMVKDSFAFDKLPDYVTQSDLQSIFKTEPMIGLRLLDNSKFMPRLVHGSLAASSVYMQDVKMKPNMADLPGKYRVAEVKWFAFYNQLNAKGQYAPDSINAKMFETALTDYVEDSKIFSAKRKLEDMMLKLSLLLRKMGKSNRKEQGKANVVHDILSKRMEDNQTINSLFTEIYSYSHDEMLQRLTRSIASLDEVLTNDSAEMKKLKDDAGFFKFSLFSKKETPVSLLKEIRNAMREAHAMIATEVHKVSTKPAITQ